MYFCMDTWICNLEVKIPWRVISQCARTRWSLWSREPNGQSGGRKLNWKEFKRQLWLLFDFYTNRPKYAKKRYVLTGSLKKGLLSSVVFVFSEEGGGVLVWKVVRVQGCSPKCQQRVEVISSCGLLTPAFAQNISKYINIFQISFQDISNISTNSKYFQCNLVSTLALEPTSLQDILGPIFRVFKIKIPRSSACS